MERLCIRKDLLSDKRQEKVSVSSGGFRIFLSCRRKYLWGIECTVYCLDRALFGAYAAADAL